MFILYECGICEHVHPWGWDGDCRDNDNRFTDAERYSEIFGIEPSNIEVRSWAERLTADKKGEG